MGEGRGERGKLDGIHMEHLLMHAEQSEESEENATTESSGIGRSQLSSRPFVK